RAVIVGAGISGLPVESVEVGVVTPGEPGGGAGVIDRRALPCFRARLTAQRDGPEAPDLLAGRLIVGGEEAARALLSAGRSADDHAVDGKRSGGRVVILAPVRHFGFPDHVAGEAVEREQM